MNACFDNKDYPVWGEFIQRMVRGMRDAVLLPDRLVYYTWSAIMERTMDWQEYRGFIFIGGISAEN